MIFQTKWITKRSRETIVCIGNNSIDTANVQSALLYVSLFLLKKLSYPFHIHRLFIQQFSFKCKPFFCLYSPLWVKPLFLYIFFDSLWLHTFYIHQTRRHDDIYIECLLELLSILYCHKHSTIHLKSQNERIKYCNICRHVSVSRQPTDTRWIHYNFSTRRVPLDGIYRKHNLSPALILMPWASIASVSSGSCSHHIQWEPVIVIRTLGESLGTSKCGTSRQQCATHCHRKIA